MNFGKVENACIPLNLDHVWGDEHENDLKSYFKVICKAKFKVKELGYGYWITPEVMPAFSPCFKMAPNNG